MKVEIRSNLYLLADQREIVQGALDKYLLHHEVADDFKLRDFMVYLSREYLSAKTEGRIPLVDVSDIERVQSKYQVEIAKSQSEIKRLRQELSVKSEASEAAKKETKYVFPWMNKKKK